MKIFCPPQIASAKVFNKENPGDGDTVSTDRTQATGWLFEADHPELIPLTRRLDRVSGLQVSFVREDYDSYERFEESEDYQVRLCSTVVSSDDTFGTPSMVAQITPRVGHLLHFRFYELLFKIVRWRLGSAIYGN